MGSFDSFIDSLTEGDADLQALQSEKTKAPSEYAPRKFTCEACGGSGLWQGGRVNKHGNARCNTCHGRGYLVTSPQDRAKARASARASKERKFEAAQEQNAEHGNGFLLEWLRGIADWNSFAASLIEQHNSGRAWSEKQVEACRRMYAKMKAKEAEKAAAPKANTPKADASRIVKMFADALANGKKRRALLAAKYEQDENGEYVLDEKGKRIVEATVKLTPARDGERIWTKVDGTYLGGIGKAGELMLKREAPAWLPKRLQEIAAAPDEECRLYGQTTGTCSCCGRELTNKTSIELGIGPICRAKWGLA